MGFGKDGKGFILYDVLNVQPGALGTKDVVLSAGQFTGNLDEDFRIVKMEMYAAWNSQAAGDILMFGVCNGDLTAAQVEECIEAVPADIDDVPANEFTMRAVFPLAIFHDNFAGTPVAAIEKTLRWTFKNPEGWTYWVYNPDSAIPVTTGGKLNVFIKIYGVWVT